MWYRIVDSISDVPGIAIKIYKRFQLFPKNERLQTLSLSFTGTFDQA